MTEDELVKYREELKKKIEEKIEAACSIEDPEEECIPCNLSAAAGVILSFCDDEKKHEELFEGFASGKLTIGDLLKEVKIPEEIEKWVKEAVPLDKTLLDVS